MSARAFLLLAMLLGLCAPGVARADTTCTATTPVTLAFGTIGSQATGPTNTMTSFDINCSSAGLSILGSASVRMCVGLGTGTTGATFTPMRSMTNANGDALSYQLYTNPARTVIWGLVPGGAPPARSLDINYSVPLIGGSGTTNVVIYGQIPAGQTLSAGAYSSAFSGAGVTLEYAFNQVLTGTATTPPLCSTTGGVGGHKTATSGFPFTVTANVLPQCSTYVTTDMDFGTNAGAITSNRDQTSTIGLTCLNRTAYTIALDNGLYPQGTTRRMRHTTNPAYFIPYELYSNSGRSTRWGSTSGVDLVSGTGTGSAQSLTVYGRAPPTTGAVAEGTYNDQIKVTITY